MKKKTQKFSAAQYVVVNLSKGWGENTETVTASRRTGGRESHVKRMGARRTFSFTSFKWLKKAVLVPLGYRSQQAGALVVFAVWSRKYTT